MRLLLLNINYLRYHFFPKPCRKILWILNTLPVRGGYMVARYERNGKFVPSLSCLVNTDYNIKLRTPLGVRLGLDEQPFS